MFLKISYSLIILGLLLLIFSILNIFDINTFHSIELYFDIKSKKQIFKVQDYGFTLIIIGFTLLVLIKNKWSEFKTPNSTKKTVILGIIALIFTTFGLLAYTLFSILRSSGYQSFIGDLKNSINDIPITFLPFIIWFIVNLSGISDNFKAGGFVKDLLFKLYNLWYWIILILTLLLLIWFAFIGNPWLTLISILWSYFYLAIMVGRQNGRTDKTVS